MQCMTQDIRIAESPSVTFEEDNLNDVLTGVGKHFHGKDGEQITNVIKSLLTPGVANSSVWKLCEVLYDASKGIYSRVEFLQVKPEDGNEEKGEKENIEPPKIKEAVTLPLPNEYVPHFVGKDEQILHTEI